MFKATLAVTMVVGALNLMGGEKVISISQESPRYFIDGQSRKAWIPIGCNICFDRLYDGKEHDDAAVQAVHCRAGARLCR